MSEPIQDTQVLAVRDLTPTVRELVLQPLERPLPFKPGQWVSLRLPVGPRPPLVRAYSMAEPESPSGRLVLVFDRVPNGLGSGYLFTLKEGDRVPAAGPFGHFILPDPSPKPPLFVARYTGVVPVRCMIRALVAQGRLGPMTLVYSVPSHRELVYDDEFRALASSQTAFRYVRLIEEDAPQEEPHRRVSNLLTPLLADGAEILPLICGVKAFVKPLRAYFAERGIDRRDIRHETYD